MVKGRKLQPKELRLSTHGKGDYVRRKLLDGTIEQVCECVYNIDVVPACPAQVPVELLQEVWGNYGSYGKERTRQKKEKGIALPDERCKYCYSLGYNGGNILPKRAGKKLRADFERHKPGVVRLGKNSEPGHPYSWRTLDSVLDLCLEFGTQIIFTTKMLPFGIQGAEEAAQYARKNNDAVFRMARENNMPDGEVVAKKFKEVGGTLSYSLGLDSLETGVCSQGFTNAWRMNQEKRYFDSGVHTVSTVVCDVTSSISDNKSHGNYLVEALSAREDYGIEVRIIPMRPPSGFVVKEIMGKSWSEARLSRKERRCLEELRSLDVFVGCEGFRDGELARLDAKPYFQPRLQNKELVARFMHPDFQRLMNEGIGFCGRIGDIEYCDKCHLADKRISFSADELVPFEDSRPKKSRKKKRTDFPLFAILKQP